MYPSGMHTRVTNNVAAENVTKITALLESARDLIEEIAAKHGLRRAIVRSRLNPSVFILIDRTNIHVVGQVVSGSGASLVVWHENTNQQLTLHQALDIAKYDVGFGEPFGFSLPLRLAQISSDKAALTPYIIEYIQSEVNRFQMMNSVISLSPIFGPAGFSVNEKSIFVLMPFRADLDEIYQTTIRQSIHDIGMVAHRADELKNVNAIMHDIWKSICEARIVVADLTDFNANVMYELGIAHTVGKDTILLHQKPREQVKFPFDLAHIRRIEYINTIAGAGKLRADLQSTISSVLRPAAFSG